jgi:hypothetical protein
LKVQGGTNMIQRVRYALLVLVIAGSVLIA